MDKRIFFRTMFDIFFDNALFKTVANLVNFCKEQQRFGTEKLKFSEKMPITHVEASKYDNRFLFNGKLKTENGRML